MAVVGCGMGEGEELGVMQPQQQKHAERAWLPARQWTCRGVVGQQVLVLRLQHRLVSKVQLYDDLFQGLKVSITYRWTTSLEKFALSNRTNNAFFAFCWRS